MTCGHANNNQDPSDIHFPEISEMDMEWNKVDGEVDLVREVTFL